MLTILNYAEESKIQILCTGSSGFIAGHLCNELSKQGHTVHGLDKDLPINCTVNLDHFIKMDLHTLNKPGDHSWLEQYDVIFHLAAETGLGASKNWLRDINHFYNVNTKTTLNLLRYSTPKKFIFTSTAALYGEGNYFQEKDVLKCNNGYGFSKAIAETIVAGSGVSYCVFRPGTVVGPYGRSVINRFVYDCVKGKTSKVFNHGYNKRSFVDVDDVVSALIAGLDLNGTYNLCTDEVSKIGDVIDYIAESAVDYKFLFAHERIAYRPSGLAQTVTLNNNKLIKTGKWTPKIDVKGMIKRLFEHYLTNLNAVAPPEWR